MLRTDVFLMDRLSLLGRKCLDALGVMLMPAGNLTPTFDLPAWGPSEPGALTRPPSYLPYPIVVHECMTLGFSAIVLKLISPPPRKCTREALPASDLWVEKKSSSRLPVQLVQYCIFIWWSRTVLSQSTPPI